jgi:hypothetical protein
VHSTKSKGAIIAIRLMFIFGMGLLVVALIWPYRVILGHYNYEELSPGMVLLPGYYAVVVNPANNSRLSRADGVRLALAEVAQQMNKGQFLLLSEQETVFNAQAVALWPLAFNIRGQNVQLHTYPDEHGGRQMIYFALGYLYDKEDERSAFVRTQHNLGDVKAYQPSQVLATGKGKLIGPESTELMDSLRVIAEVDNINNESTTIITFAGDAGRWPYLVALDAARREAVSRGFPYFLILDGRISGNMVALQVRTRFLKEAMVPVDLDQRGFQSFMIESSGFQ